jgi:hypothetical protein
LEVTEDCWVPPPVLQSFVACEWGSHSLCPDASLFPYHQVKLLCLWPNKASDFGICQHARRQLMLPLKVPGVSHCLITSLLCNCIQLFKLIFIHVYIIHKYQFNTKSQLVVLVTVICFQHSKWMPMNAD